MTGRTCARKRLCAVALIFTGGCAAVLPALQTLAVAFGQDLLAAAAVNHAPRYALQVEALLATLAREASGMNFQPQLVQLGYQTPLPDYLRRQQQTQQQYGDAYGYPTVAQEQNPYGQSAPEQQSPYSTTDSYDTATTSSDPYGTSTSSADPYGAATTTSDPYGTATTTSDPYGPGGADGAPVYEDPYSADYSASTYQTRSGAGPVSLGVALMVQRAGSGALETFEDGAHLHDGRGVPAKGDLIKIHFRSSCDCYLYVIGIDATGYVAQIFPDLSAAGGNPVRAGEDYLLPGSGEYWALDDQRGVENLYFIAARERRVDLEETLAALSSEPRSDGTRGAASTRPVQQPAVIPTTRGMVKVSVNPVAIKVGNRAATITPDAFVSTLGDVDLVVSRWFYHD